MADVDTLTLPVLPLSAGVVLPQMVITLALETDEARAAAGEGAEQLLLVPKSESGRYARVGTIVTIENRGTLPSGVPALVVRATARAHVGAGVIGATSALWVHAEPVVDGPVSDNARAKASELRAAFRALFESLGGPRLVEFLRGADEPGALADLAGWWPDLSFERKVELLETVDVETRVEKVLGWTKEALAELEVAKSIRDDVAEGMEKTQREYLLRQQLAAIRKELGEGEDGEDLIESYRAQLATLVDAGAVSDATRDAIEREIGRLERTPEQNTEHGWIRTWLDTVFELPWGERTIDHLDVGDARRILDEDHTGLDDIKDRIVEFLAVRKLRAERGFDDRAADGASGDSRRKPGAIVALVGPPGVGKTSLGESIARALGRRFVRVALRRGATRSHRARDAGGGFDEPGVPARRGRQGRQRLARRPVRRVARGARPGAEPQLPRPLPRGGPRPVRRAVHRDGERARDHPRAAARPHGHRAHRRVHRGGEGRHRTRPPGAAPGPPQRAARRRGRPPRRRPARDRLGLHP
jgi:ATP-dependent Lon protease